MKIEDLLDLTLREILEKYCAIYNLECGYYYGIAPVNLINKLLQEYNVKEEYPEAFEVENVVNDEILVNYEEKILDYDRLEKIMKNLDITKKEENNDGN